MKLTNTHIVKLIQGARMAYKEFLQHCNILVAQGIDFYVYCYMDKKGRVAILSTDVSFLETYLNTHAYLNTPYLNEFAKLPYLILYSELEQLTQKNHPLIQIANDTQCNLRKTGAAIVIPEDDHLLYINFAGENLSNSFIAALAPSIEKFSKNITHHFQKSIQQTLEHDIIAPYYRKILKAIPERPCCIPNAKPNVSRREFSCLKLLMQGYSYAKIADLLHISERTVANHLQNIKLKNNINSPSALADLYQYLKYTNKNYSLLGELE